MQHSARRQRRNRRKGSATGWRGSGFGWIVLAAGTSKLQDGDHAGIVAAGPSGHAGKPQAVLRRRRIGEAQGIGCLLTRDITAAEKTCIGTRLPDGPRCSTLAIRSLAPIQPAIVDQSTSISRSVEASRPRFRRRHSTIGAPERSFACSTSGMSPESRSRRHGFTYSLRTSRRILRRARAKVDRVFYASTPPL